MSDLISRQAAIETIRKLDDYTNTLYAFAIGSAINAIKDLPAAQPKKGKWCVTPDGKLVCSNCYENPTNRIIVNGNLIYDVTPIKEKMRYCPNCGADMRGGEQ